MYNIALTHGPVVETKYLGNDTVSYILEDGSVYDIQFSIVTESGKKMYRRLVSTDGDRRLDMVEWDVFDENLSCEDFAQWTADNFTAEILDCFDDLPTVTV